MQTINKRVLQSIDDQLHYFIENILQKQKRNNGNSFITS